MIKYVFFSTIKLCYILFIYICVLQWDTLIIWNKNLSRNINIKLIVLLHVQFCIILLKLSVF